MSDINQKIQKLATAVYFITSFFSDNEPLKWRLRGISTDLIAEGVKDRNLALQEIRLLLGMAKSVGLISETNHEILANEFSKVEIKLPEFPALPEPEKTFIPLPKEESKPEIKKDNNPPHKPDLLDLDEIENRPDLKDFGAVSVKKNKRQSIIINLLKRKKEIMIKDVTPLISGCSEKTIQRELSEMVVSGILRKMGEKRWSRYMLA